MACAASGISRNVTSALGALAGLTSTAIRAALGTSSCSNSSRLATDDGHAATDEVGHQRRQAARKAQMGSAGTFHKDLDRRSTIRVSHNADCSPWHYGDYHQPTF